MQASLTFNCTGVDGRYEKGATDAWRMDENVVTIDDVAEWEAFFQRRPDIPLPIHGLPRRQREAKCEVGVRVEAVAGARHSPHPRM